MKTTFFDALKTPLLSGVNLIEASAGTGKTYTLAMLVLRFIVEQNLPLEKILVVTFTKAATEELRERVRLRLFEAKQTLKFGVKNELFDWLNSLPIENAEIEHRLQIALLSIDQASIFTIHSFCQKVLREHALESGQLFNAELTDDLVQITQSCADDFWRKNIYSRNAYEAAILTAEYKTPDALLKSVNKIGHHVKIYPEKLETVSDVFEKLNPLLDAAKIELTRCAEKFEQAFLEDKFKATIPENLAAVQALFNSESAKIKPEKFDFLTTHGIFNSLNGNQFRARQGISSEERKANFLDEFALKTAIFDNLKNTLKNCSVIFRRELVENLRHEIDQRLLQRNALTFDHLIIRLDEALRGENKSQLLIEELRSRFTVALIDEFQDTDSSQWFIFKTLFAAQSQYLYLIGDPKQAIYKFRGADIYSYLNAKHSANTTFTLAQNWRSHPNLVGAVNHLFTRENPFLIKELEFNDVQPANSHEKGTIYFENKPLSPFVLWDLQNDSAPYWQNNSGTNKIVENQFCYAVVDEILKLLQKNYFLQPQNRRLKPKDIAILVRKNKQAKAFQIALREAGIPSVLNSTESIFASVQAGQLHIFLNAVVNCADIHTVKQALTLNWFASIPDGKAFYKIVNDENALDSWLAKFLNYHEQWQKLGLMAMMHTFLATENATSQLAKTPLAERELTNIYHLLELLQEAALNEHLSPPKTLDWLRIAITNALGKKIDSAENQQLRLESDDDAVNIVTMHKSKGLEYPIVFCASLWMPSDLWEKDRAACHIDGEMCVDLGSEKFEKHRELALFEQRAEDARMFYVAVTRAKYRCYLAWANVRTKENANNSAIAPIFTNDGFSVDLPDFFEHESFVEREKPTGHYSPEIQTHNLKQLKNLRDLRFSPWQMSSYSALSALSKQIVADLPEDKAQEPLELSPPIKLDLPRGAHTGNVIHELLENFDFADLANGADISTARDNACSRYGLKVTRPEIIDELLQKVVQTPLSNDANFCLKNLPKNSYLKEMPFYLATQKIDTREINRILENEPSFQPLDSKTINGYLTGFIDLICEVENRFYVIDYKSNYLPDYSSETMLGAMREHNYGLQYWLYCVVLHRYLENRLPDYDIKKHFGGVRYLFVRGMDANVPLSGVFETKPATQKLLALANLFSVT
jgi:exodeoxyribonuclease V beta subunit